MENDVRELICEGRCNPDLMALDDAIFEYRKEEARMHDGKRQPIADEGLIARLRRLRHTPHAQVAPDRWSCVDCAMVRRF